MALVLIFYRWPIVVCIVGCVGEFLGMETGGRQSTNLTDLPPVKPDWGPELLDGFGSDFR